MMPFFNNIPTRFLVFSLALAAIVMFGFHPTADFKDLASLLIGGFLGYITAELKVTSSEGTAPATKFTLTKD